MKCPHCNGTGRCDNSFHDGGGFLDTALDVVSDLTLGSECPECGCMKTAPGECPHCDGTGDIDHVE